MTENNVVVTTEEKSLVDSNNFITELMSDLGDVDLGYSTDQEDSQTPIIALLQDNSGEVKKKHNKYIEGAEAGMFINRSQQKLYEDGFYFIPCGFAHVWVEWPAEIGEGSPITQYKYDRLDSNLGKPSDTTEKSDPNNPDKIILSRENGNRLVETRYHYGLIIDDVDSSVSPAVIPFAGTGHTVSKNWTSILKSKSLPNGRPAPAWLQIYKITSVFREKGSQSWYNLSPKFHQFIDTKYLLEQARELNESCQAGDVIVVGASEETVEETVIA